MPCPPHSILPDDMGSQEEGRTTKRKEHGLGHQTCWAGGGGEGLCHLLNRDLALVPSPYRPSWFSQLHNRNEMPCLWVPAFMHVLGTWYLGGSPHQSHWGPTPRDLLADDRGQVLPIRMWQGFRGRGGSGPWPGPFLDPDSHSCCSPSWSFSSCGWGWVGGGTNECAPLMAGFGSQRP